MRVPRRVPRVRGRLRRRHVHERQMDPPPQGARLQQPLLAGLVPAREHPLSRRAALRRYPVRPRRDDPRPLPLHGAEPVRRHDAGGSSRAPASGCSRTARAAAAPGARRASSPRGTPRRPTARPTSAACGCRQAARTARPRRRSRTPAATRPPGRTAASRRTRARLDAPCTEVLIDPCWDTGCDTCGVLDVRMRASAIAQPHRAWFHVHLLRRDRVARLQLERRHRGSRRERRRLRRRLRPARPEAAARSRAAAARTRRLVRGRCRRSGHRAPSRAVCASTAAGRRARRAARSASMARGASRKAAPCAAATGSIARCRRAPPPAAQRRRGVHARVRLPALFLRGRRRRVQPRVDHRDHLRVRRRRDAADV